MRITNPTEITPVAWEGQLTMPATIYTGGRSAPPASMTLGAPAVWPLAAAMLNEPAQAWEPPEAGVDYWLVRVSAILREPAGMPSMIELQQTLQVMPANPDDPPESVYVAAIFPTNLGRQDKAEFPVLLAPDLSFHSDQTLDPVQPGVEITYAKAFMSMQGMGVGGATVSWLLKRQSGRASAPLHALYAVVGARRGVRGISLAADAVLSQRTGVALFRYILPEEAKAAWHATWTADQ